MPMLADGNRVTVWYAEAEDAPPEPNLGVVRWSNDEGMQVHFDSPAQPDEQEMWVDAKEDDWAWGDLAPPHVPAKLRQSNLALHGWIRQCKRGFSRMQAYSLQLITLRATLVIAPVSLLGQWHDEIADFAPSLRVVTWHACAHTGVAARASSANGEGSSCSHGNGTGSSSSSSSGKKKVAGPPKPWSEVSKAILGQFETADIVLTTSGMAAKLLGYRFHRIVVDEVHTDDVKNAFLHYQSETEGVPGKRPPPHAEPVSALGKGIYRPGCPAPAGFRSTPSANFEMSAPHVWLLTGTPLTRGIDDLHLGAHLLGHADFGLRLHAAAVGPGLLAAMKTLCIRHRKAQLIQGEAALSLPKSSTRIVWLSMTADERNLYSKAAEKDASLVPKIEHEGAKDFFLEMVLRCRRQACSNVYKFSGQERAFEWPQVSSMYAKRQKAGTEYTFEYSPKLEACTKLRALNDDLTALRAAEPNCMAVVFTHHRETHQAVVELLRQRQSAMSVYEIHGAMDNNRRHDAVREFQGRGKVQISGAKVLVVTIRVGAVGMTLTAASRVYLFEPAFNPAAEAQAAGRIHRLGQTRDVLITRFVYRDSIEENIVRLHEAIAAGRVQMQDGLVPPNGVRLLTRGAAATA